MRLRTSFRWKLFSSVCSWTLQEAELEDLLFAGNANDITGFGREDEEQNERSAVAELIGKVRGGAQVAPFAGTL